MALITCKECRAEVSDTAATCPKCGARVKPKSTAWMWILGLLVGVPIAFVVLGGILLANDPDYPAKVELRRKYELCMKEFNDPLTDQQAKRMIVGPVCLRFRNEFISRYHSEP